MLLLIACIDLRPASSSSDSSLSATIEEISIGVTRKSLLCAVLHLYLVADHESFYRHRNVIDGIRTSAIQAIHSGLIHCLSSLARLIEVGVPDANSTA